MFHEISSRVRVLKAINHKEPDRIPLDFGGCSQTGIRVNAYENLLAHLHMDKPVEVTDMVQQFAGIDEDILNQFKVDTRGLNPSMSEVDIESDQDPAGYTYFTDRWGIRYRKPKVGGYYYDLVGHPLGGEISTHDIDHFKFPDPTQLRGDMGSIFTA
jgi:uroporphyrinogen decarboxylase